MNDTRTFQGESTCPRCGRAFACGMRAGAATCWCAELPHRLPPDPAAQGCYCPDCLREAIAAAQERPR